jgi:hypothetical protein
MRRAIALAVLAAACSSRPPRGTTGGEPPDAAVATTPVDAGGAPPLTRGECDALLDHVLAIQLDDLRARKPPEEWPTADQVADQRAVLAAEMLEPCAALDRAVFDCAIAATDATTLRVCAE